MTDLFFDRDGQQISTQEFVLLSDISRYKNVARTWLGKQGVVVSTVWLGLDLSFGEHKPVLFETMVFPADKDGLIETHDEFGIRRYYSEKDAMEGHLRMVKDWMQREPIIIDGQVNLIRKELM